MWKYISVIDLFDAGQYSSLRKTNAYSSVRKLAGRSLVRWSTQVLDVKAKIALIDQKLSKLLICDYIQLIACIAILRDFEETEAFLKLDKWSGGILTGVPRNNKHSSIIVYLFWLYLDVYKTSE